MTAFKGNKTLSKELFNTATKTARNGIKYYFSQTKKDSIRTGISTWSGILKSTIPSYKDSVKNNKFMIIIVIVVFLVDRWITKVSCLALYKGKWKKIEKSITGENIFEKNYFILFGKKSSQYKI